ncbi:FRG domain-containing protein [Listeria monocytogenes]|nr:FRG domain-containing protein [Listeria monocytogenes]ECJ9721733.1 FRG domain-containing protein [Listeria monocytogenes]TYU27987.1 FRG domain-containing protein [Listeria monocytogenes]
MKIGVIAVDKITNVSEFLEVTKNFSKEIFYRGENKDNGDTACVATAIRDAEKYDLYSSRIESFDRMVRESALLSESDLLIPFAQHSGLATKLLDITSNPLVALYFACQKSADDSDGFVYTFDDYVDATALIEKYPFFDLEDELLQHLKYLDDQRYQINLKSMKEEVNSNDIIEYTAVKHDELTEFGKVIELYRNKYLRGGYSKRARARGINIDGSPFATKLKELYSQIDGIKKWILQISSVMNPKPDFLPDKFNENTPAIDFVHPYMEKWYVYYNEQYKSFDVEVKEYLIALECIVAFLNDRSSVGNLAAVSQFAVTKMDFLPNLLYQPVMTFKRGLSQYSAFFVQTIFDKHENKFIDPYSGETKREISRQLLKCQANFSQSIIVDGKYKKSILEELDKIGVNKATMFGDADNIAEYIMNS